MTDETVRYINIYPPEVCKMGQEEFVHYSWEEAQRNLNPGGVTHRFVREDIPEVLVKRKEELYKLWGGVPMEEVVFAQNLLDACSELDDYDMWKVADDAINEAYPDFYGKGARWWGAKLIPNWGILRGAIVKKLREAIAYGARNTDASE